MGEPATPTAKDRAETRELAARIVESVREDRAMPLDLTWYSLGNRTPDGARYHAQSDVEQLALQLAQEIELLRAERDACWSRLENWDWRGLLIDARCGDYESIRFALADVVAMEDAMRGPDLEMEKP